MMRQTNATMRQALGEHGFIEQEHHVNYPGFVRSSWHRNRQVVFLREYEDGREPRLTNSMGERLDVTKLGPININAKQPTEGNQAP